MCILCAPMTCMAHPSCSKPRPKGSPRRRPRRAHRSGAAAVPARKLFTLSFDQLVHSTDSPENVTLSQDIYGRLKKANLIYVKPVEQFYDPVKQMFLADRYIKGECPNCHSKDQYGDACEKSAAPCTRRRS